MQSGKACHFKKEKLEIITEQVQKQNTVTDSIDLRCILSWKQKE